MPSSACSYDLDRKSTRLNSSHLGISYAVFCLLLRSDRKSTRLNSSHLCISYAVFCLKKRYGRNSRPAPPVSRAGPHFRSVAGGGDERGSQPAINVGRDVPEFGWGHEGCSFLEAPAIPRQPPPFPPARARD